MQEKLADWFAVYGTPAEWAVFGAIVAEVLFSAIDYRKERWSHHSLIHSKIDFVDLTKNVKPLYDMEEYTQRVSAHVHRVREPERFAHIRAGNEMLVVGPAQTGKEEWLYELGRRAGIRKAIIVTDSCDEDVLAHAQWLIEKKPRLWRRVAHELAFHKTDKNFYQYVKRLITRPNAGKPEKVMLILTRLDKANGEEGVAHASRLSSLIQTASRMSNVWVVATKREYSPVGKVEIEFGHIQPIPNDWINKGEQQEAKRMTPGLERLNSKVAEGYLFSILAATNPPDQRYELSGITEDEFLKRLATTSSAEIEDIIAHCQTFATHSVLEGHAKRLQITRQMFEEAIAFAMPEAIRPQELGHEAATPKLTVVGG